MSGSVRPLRIDRPAGLRQKEKIRPAIGIDIGNRSHNLARGWIELLDQIDLIVEIAIQLAADERAALVKLADIRSSIEVRIDGDARDLSIAIIQAPEIGTAVAVPIFSA